MRTLKFLISFLFLYSQMGLALAQRIQATQATLDYETEIIKLNCIGPGKVVHKNGKTSVECLGYRSGSCKSKYKEPNGQYTGTADCGNKNVSYEPSSKDDETAGWVSPPDDDNQNTDNEDWYGKIDEKSATTPSKTEVSVPTCGTPTGPKCGIGSKKSTSVTSADTGSSEKTSTDIGIPQAAEEASSEINDAAVTKSEETKEEKIADVTDNSVRGKCVITDGQAQMSISACPGGPSTTFLKEGEASQESMSFSTSDEMKKGKKRSKPGSEDFVDCQRYSNKPWPKFNQQHDWEKWKASWTGFYKTRSEKMKGTFKDLKRSYRYQEKSLKCLKAASEEACVKTHDEEVKNLAEATNDHIKKIITESGKVDNQYKKIEICIVADAVLKDADLSGDTFSDLEKGEDGNYVKKSMDGTVVCKARGVETLDFNACASTIGLFDAQIIAKQGLEVYQQFDFQDFQMEQRFDLQKDAGQDYKKPLIQQRDSILKQADMATQRAVIEAAKMGIAFSGMSGMPDREEIIAKCVATGPDPFTIATFRRDETIHALRSYKYNSIKSMEATILNAAATTSSTDSASYFNNVEVLKLTTEISNGNEHSESAYNKDQKYIDTDGDKILAVDEGEPLSSLKRPTPLSHSGQISEDELLVICDDVITNGGLAFLQNGAMKDVFKGKMIQAGIDMASHLLQAHILRKQADRIDDALKGIKNFEPIPMTFTGLDLQTTLCAPEGFPEHPDCMDLDPNRVFGFSDQNFNFGGGGSTEVARIQTDEGAGGGSNAADARDRSILAGKIGSVGNSVNKSAGKLRNGSAATIKKGDGSAGGGGGASGGLGASAPGGGGSGGGAPGGGSYAAQKAGQYEGGGRSTGSGGGGLKSRTSKKKKSKNPFKRLGKNGALNFRGPSAIGSKKSNIFTMISKRYDVVAKSSRLMEYTKK